jgi:hypothetical protein
MAFNMLANVLVHSLVHSLNQDANQRLFLTLLHNLVHILVLMLNHMLNHTLDEASSEHSIELVLGISFLTFNGPLIEIIASHFGKAVTSAAWTHFEGRILVAESGARIQVAGSGRSNTGT